MANEKPVAIVTGGGGGIGEATAALLASRGVRVVAADVRTDMAAAAAEKIRSRGHEALAVTVDVTDETAVKAMVDTVVERFGRLDILVNSAGLDCAKPFLDIPADEYRRVMEVNATGTWLCCHYAIAQMLKHKRGAIVNLTSIAGQKGGGMLGTAAYATSKGALIAMTKALGREFAKSGIRINAVAPGLTLTEFVHRQLADKPPGFLDTMIASTPMNRGAQPEEIATVIAFLASDEASFITGHVYNADGGSAI